ncbi:dihydrodipicolinate synthase [Apiospora kogelbergensis]|uniref:dihydrodipicolinate synthase n=1 Tax=Apiospora kogelbergensis TaxID=1337665 RepID=UPI0031307822
MSPITRPLVPGIYVPTVLFFDDENEDIDTDTVQRHAVHLAREGVAGIAVQGSNGEAVHLTSQERGLVTRTTRDALDSAGFTHMPLIVGCGAQSTREAIQLCNEAAHSGGDYALVLPPSYYQGLFKPETMKSFFTDLADASPIPIILYNYPPAFTCANTGKLARVAAAFRGPSANGKQNGSAAAGNSQFICFGGSGDFTLQTLISGGQGIIGGIANLAPKTCIQTMELYQQGNIKEAQRLQEILARGDWAAIQTGLVGTKVAMQECMGYGGWARKPLPRPEGEERRKMVEGFAELMELEKKLGGSTA